MGDVAEFSKGSGYSKGDLTAEGTPIILYGRLYTKYETIIEDVDTFVNMKEKSVISRSGEVIVPSSGETAEDIARASVVGKDGVILGGDLNIVRADSTIDPTFLAITISNGNQQKELSKRAQGKSVVHISNSDLKDVVLQHPALPEQTAIGTFFATLDSTITLYKQKLDGLRTLKKGYLQQMFPQAGESVPRVRFEGFEGDWESRAFGEVADVIGGGTPDTKIPEYWGGDIDWYAPAEIGDQIYVNGSRRKITTLGLQKSSATILPVGTVLFTSRAGIGNTAILGKEGATNQGFQSIVPHKNELDSYFLYSRTHELKRYGETVGAGSTFVEVSGKQMSNMNILLPALAEQAVIGDFFRSLDGQITAQQSKVEQLQQLKMAYLQKMFV